MQCALLRLRKLWAIRSTILNPDKVCHGEAWPHKTRAGGTVKGEQEEMTNRNRNPSARPTNSHIKAHLYVVERSQSAGTLKPSL